MSESPEEKYNRLQHEIQRAILRDYPNPERRGCPRDGVVKQLAKNPRSIRVEDEMDESSSWYHVTHCSPCYATFLEVREAGRVQAWRGELTRRAIIATSFAVVAAGTGWLFIHRDTPVQSVELDLDASAAYRGENENIQKPRMELPNGKLKVTLRLPEGSAVGLYRVELRNAASNASIFAASVWATVEKQYQILRLDLDLHVSRGTYILAVRNDHREVWRYYSIWVV